MNYLYMHSIDERQDKTVALRTGFTKETAHPRLKKHNTINRRKRRIAAPDANVRIALLVEPSGNKHQQPRSKNGRDIHFVAVPYLAVHDPPY